MAKPDKLTLSLIHDIETKVLDAHHPQVVARQLGVSKKIWEEWMAKGEEAYLRDMSADDPDYIYRALFERIEEAEAQAEIDLLEQIRQEVRRGKPGTTLLFVAERRFADRWRRKEMTREPGKSFDSEIHEALSQAGVRVNHTE